MTTMSRELSRRHMRRGSAFLAVGLVGFVVDAALYNLLVFGGGHGPLFDQPLLAKSLSLLVSLAVSYLGNKLWTYRDRGAPMSASEVARFAAANAIAVLLHLACLWFSRAVLGQADVVSDNLWGTVVGQAVATAFRYVAYTWWVFPHAADDDPDAAEREPRATDAPLRSGAIPGDRTVRIAVDLDGTLIRSDLLWESAARHALRTPLGAARIIRWTLQGPVTLKSQLAARVDLDAALLPYKREVVEDLARRRAEGAELVLATAAARRYGQAVADHLGLFDAVIATDPEGPNRRSAQKAEAISAHFGGAPWTYVGDSPKDFAVWSSAAAAITVDADARVDARLRAAAIPVERIRTRTGASWRSWLRQLRPHQWAKNLLVFVPLATSHEVLEDLSALLAALGAFAAFSLCASAVYAFNDLADLDADRQHPRKRARPLASGTISIRAGLATGVILGVAGLWIAWLVNGWTLAALLVYLVATNLYSLWLKRKPMIDVTTLALLYTWRVVTGCVAISVEPTVWLLAFSTFFFFGLALVKRFAELYGAERARGYGRDDTLLVSALGVSSSLVAVLVFVLYIDQSASTGAYGTPQALWLAVPLLLYWCARTWLVAFRGEMNDDPLVYAVRNPVSLVTVGLIAAVWTAATVLRIG
ncbi:UbiA family prenyltransferase [Microbacterium rhizophilus]|uniref:UbiA family prenyltransferase n=1 Tax=Microbacterium rhizophilus TaxID=3138934 RepID=UPI0031ED0EBA